MGDKKRAMLSQPMAGKTDEEIAETRDEAVADLGSMGYEVVNTLFTDEWYSPEAMGERGVVQVPLCYLAKSLENMSKCHAAYFCKGWEQARGCRIEHDAASAYGLEVLYAPGAFAPHDAMGLDDRREPAAYAVAVTRSRDERGRWLSAWPAVDTMQRCGTYPAKISWVDPGEMACDLGYLLETIGRAARGVTVYMSFDEGLLEHAATARDALQALGIKVEMCGDWTGGSDGDD